MHRRIAAFALALMLVAAAPPVRQGIELAIPQSPTPLPTAAGTLLRYELHLTNFASRDIDIVGIRLRDPRSGDTIATLIDASLKAAVRIVGLPVDGTDHRRLAAGRRAIVYLDIPIDGRPPKTIDNLVEFRLRSGELAEARRSVDVGTLPLPRLGPPLAGGPWVAVYESAMDFGHRRYVYAVAGAAHVPGRHAIDWMRPADGRYTALGASVLAVADAVVVAARDGVPEPDATAARENVALGDATGNYIALDLGAGHVAFYEHLMPGLRVARGDRVRRGQVIARVGSTGQASEPHLHFHLASANHPLDAEGLPYRLDGVRVIGRYASIEAFGRGDAWQRTPATDAAFPPPNAVVTFDAAAAQRVADPQ